MTIPELKAYDKPTIGAEATFRALGWGRTSARDTLRRRPEKFPLKPIFLGRKIVFSTIELKHLLGVE